LSLLYSSHSGIVGGFFYKQALELCWLTFNHRAAGTRGRGHPLPLGMGANVGRARGGYTSTRGGNAPAPRVHTSQSLRSQQGASSSEARQNWVGDRTVDRHHGYSGAEEYSAPAQASYRRPQAGIPDRAATLLEPARQRDDRLGGRQGRADDGRGGLSVHVRHGRPPIGAVDGGSSRSGRGGLATVPRNGVMASGYGMGLGDIDDSDELRGAAVPRGMTITIQNIPTVSPATVRQPSLWACGLLTTMAQHRWWSPELDARLFVHPPACTCITSAHGLAPHCDKKKGGGCFPLPRCHLGHCRAALRPCICASQ
jgi:hypothetical protein